jgi:tripartite-type tricarboxylate transporter receptor subunit TctC
MAQIAPHDGTALAEPSETIVVDQLFGTGGVAYDAMHFAWVGRMAKSETAYFTWQSSPTKNFADLQKRETTMGSSGSGATTDVPHALIALAGAKIKLVSGYRGSADVLLALERGEIEAAYALWPDLKARKADWLADRKVNLLFVIGEQRLADLPDIPNIDELGATDEGRRVLKFFTTTGSIGRAIYTTQDVPADRVAILRQAFSAAMADPGLAADATRLGMPVDPLDGAALQQVATAPMRYPPAIVAQAKAFRQQ